MALIYRSMLADGDKPQIGPSAKTLGARVPDDIAPDANGKVHPHTGGMSVVSAWCLLPVHRVPRRLKDKFPRAAGSNALCCWRPGEGPFTAGPIGDRLVFRPDPDKPTRHGFVEPAEAMELAAYQAALAATQDQWVIDEA
jgi:hypothetical protein